MTQFTNKIISKKPKKQAKKKMVRIDEAEEAMRAEYSERIVALEFYREILKEFGDVDAHMISCSAISVASALSLDIVGGPSFYYNSKDNII